MFLKLPSSTDNWESERHSYSDVCPRVRVDVVKEVGVGWSNSGWGHPLSLIYLLILKKEDCKINFENLFSSILFIKLLFTLIIEVEKLFIFWEIKIKMIRLNVINWIKFNFLDVYYFYEFSIYSHK
jgi:hypothetical protein